MKIPITIVTLWICNMLGLCSALGGPGNVLYEKDMLDSIQQSTPALGADGTVYVGDTGGFLNAYNPRTRTDVSQYLGTIVSAPAIGHDGTVYVGTASATTDNVYALDPISLRVKAKFRAQGKIRGSPAIDRDWTVYIATEAGVVYALDPETLQQRWRKDLRQYSDGSGVTLDFLCGPIISPDGHLIVASVNTSNSKVIALDAKSGNEHWRYGNSAVVRNSPAIGAQRNLFFVDGQSYLKSLTPQGQLRWMQYIGGELSSPIVGPLGEVYVASKADAVECYSNTGARKWRFTTGGPAVEGTPVLGANGLLYFGGGLRDVFCVKSSDGTLVWRRTLDRAGTRGNMALSADGVLWFGGGRYLLGIEAETSLSKNAYWPCFRGNSLHSGIQRRGNTDPAFLNPFRFAGGRLGLALYSEPNCAVQIESSDNLADWKDLSLIFSVNGLYSHTASTAPASRQRFYRARRINSSWAILATCVNPANGHLYCVIASSTALEGVSWTAAEAAAVALGGHLVTINNAAENQWIAERFSRFPYLWIGLNDAASEGTFRWSSGQPVTYQNFYSGEPNNYEGGEDYVHIYNFSSGSWKWNDNQNSPTRDQGPFYGLAELE